MREALDAEVLVVREGVFRGRIATDKTHLDVGEVDRLGGDDRLAILVEAREDARAIQLTCVEGGARLPELS